MGALSDFERLKRKSESDQCFNDELVEFKKIVNENDFDHSSYTEFLRFILENAESEGGDKRKRGKDPAENSSRNALQQEHHHGGEDQVVPTNMALQIQITEEGENGGTSNPVSKRPRRKAPCNKTKSKGVNEDRAPALQLGVKDKTQWQMDFPEVIEIDEDDDEDEVSGPHWRLAGRQGKKDKGKRVVSENPTKMQRDVVSRKGILISPCVPSKRYHESGDNAETLAFRNDVLEVLGKPFNLEEYIALMEAIKAGSYHEYYPELITTLQLQPKQEKRLAILRGFFFWLQNLTREGAFRPWNDPACLQVNPRHVV